ncbi:MAG: sporulation protein YqfD [Bacillota bacterium]|nr:sporulation protein YqfD [Bacillota bacterium]
MNRLVGWLFGTVTARVVGAQPEDFLNLCARENLILWRMERLDPFTLLVRVSGRQYPRMCRLAETCQCTVQGPKRRGLPFFLLGFRRRYALLAGLILCLVLGLVGGQVVLTVEVSGNEKIPEEVIISQLRLCGVSTGTWGPSVPIRAVENRMMRFSDDLAFFSLNLRGTRAEVIVRERDPAPKRKEEKVPTNIVATADGVITHLEPWRGDAQFVEGDPVQKGDILISGRIRLDPPPNVESELGTALVHADGKVLARTQRTLTAELSLTAPGKNYTGEKVTRRFLSVMGRRINFYKNSGIPYEKYDIISQLKSWTPAPGRTLPVIWGKETVQEYTDAAVRLDGTRAEELLRQKLLEALEESLDQGEILQTEFSTEQTGEVLRVTLQAQCDEQIGRMEKMDTQEIVLGPLHPDKGTYGQDETNTKEQSP